MLFSLFNPYGSLSLEEQQIIISLMVNQLYSEMLLIWKSDFQIIFIRISGGCFQTLVDWELLEEFCKCMGNSSELRLSLE